MSDVTLIAMPYAAIERPSLALGLLKAGLERAGIAARVRYLNVAFAARIGPEAYHFLAHTCSRHLTGEWTFAAAAFRESAVTDEAYIQRILLEVPIIDETTMRELREQAAAFVEDVAAAVLEDRPRIVGCSSLFQQHVASLALLRRIREMEPSVVTLLGGANCEGSMGRTTHESFPWVDYVISGEADDLLPPFCRQILDLGRDIPREALPESVLGPCHRNDGTQPPRACVHNLDRLPAPDFQDYFRDLEETGVRHFVYPGLVVETSRGCWWGQKHQCLFCGLNGSGMHYRSKSPARALEEVVTLAERCGVHRIETTDNILDMAYFDTFLPALEAADKGLQVAYEVKSNLRRKQVRQLSDAGVRWIQPGIENLHNAALGVLRKGVKTWTNLQLLKWCLEFGVYCMWNFLVGMPGEEDEWYAEVADWLPLVSHLQPPAGGALPLSPICFDRFSAFFRRPEEFGLKLTPLWPYAHVYPLSAEKLAELAYFFEDETRAADGSTTTKLPGASRLADVIVKWRDDFYEKFESLVPAIAADRPQFNMHMLDDGVRITDTRPCAVRGEFELQGLDAEVFKACETAKTLDALMAALHGDRSHSEVQDTLRRLVDQRLVLAVDDRFLSLAVRAPQRPYPELDDFPGGTVLHRSS